MTTEVSCRDVLRAVLVEATRQSLARQDPDGGMARAHVGSHLIHVMGVCYAGDWPGNPYHRNEALLKAIIRLGDHVLGRFDPARGFAITGNGEFNGWDEWLMIKWMETARLARADLPPGVYERWTPPYLALAEHVMAMCIDMDTFDGAIPNHGVWAGVYLYRVGQLFGVPRYQDMGALIVERVLGSQTPDGCFREFQSAALMQGTPVTIYNLISALAIDMYRGYSGDPAATAALERAWHWFYDYLFPDFSTPPNLDFRMAYHAANRGDVLPAFFMNQPEGARIARLALAALRARLDGDPPGLSGHSLGFLSLQYDKLEDRVEEREPRWPEFRRMAAAEAGMRRRNGWHACLSGLTNVGNSNVGLRLFGQERQDAVALYHEREGLIIGSAHSMIQEELSTFVFYETGAARYLPDEAYLKSSPALDTMLLRYGGNVGAVSVDTREAREARIILSLHGERGHSATRGPGHTLTAMAARAHLALRLKTGQEVRLGEREWTLGESDETVLRIAVPAGAELSFGGWALAADAPWEWRWPVRTYNPYRLLAPGERLGLAEVVLFTRITTSEGGNAPRPTVAFRVLLRHDSGRTQT